MGLSNAKAEKIEKTFETEQNGARFYGLENYGNTCYCNSVLQALFFCEPFRTEVLKHYQPPKENTEKEKEKEKEKVLDENETLLSCLCEVFAAISSSKKRVGVFGPKKFIIKLKKENELFRGPTQQDAQEFLNYLLNEVSEIYGKKTKQLNPNKENNNNTNENNQKPQKTFVQNIFEGILTNETQCLTCDSKSSRDETFLDLSLDVENVYSINTGLKHFTSVELMNKEDKFYCEVCRSKQEARKRILIKKFPETLVLHLKRFKYMESLSRHVKLHHMVGFPFELKIKTQIAEEDEELQTKIYDLFAIVIHIGVSPNSGHYVSIVKNYNKWILFDDDSCELVDEELIKTRYADVDPPTDSESEPKKRTDTSYLLFYQTRTEKSTINKILEPIVDPKANGNPSQINGKVNGNPSSKQKVHKV